MTDNEPGEISLRTRTLGVIHPDDDTLILVEHVYTPEGEAGPCAECGAPAHDPGMVGLIVDREEGEAVSMLLTAEDALVLANRLTRAASLVLESDEDDADLEREAARFTAKGSGEEAAG